MSKTESTIIGLFIGIICPWLTFVAFWWTTALLHLQGFPVPEGMIKAAALTGLGLGCLLDVLFLRRWVEKFYTANLRWMIVVYLGCFVVAFASFMGFPIGTFALGILAGTYIGRREHHHRANREPAGTALSRTALLTSSLTTLAALPIGILGLQEPLVGTVFEKCSGMDRQWLDGTAGYVLVGLFCLLLFAVQHWCSRKVGLLAFGFGSKAGSRISSSAGGPQL
jgi:hypothetical protein